VSYIITSAALTISETVMPVLPSFLASQQTVMLLAALVMTGMVCILMGCGIPTTANYLIMVTVAAPTLVQLGVEPIVAHFFVFYYGVLADITPPVCIAAYAAAGMANSDPFRTGNTAFRLGLGKVLVPFVFVLSPALLIVTKGFTWYDFWVTFVGCSGDRGAVGSAVELLPGEDAAVGALAGDLRGGAADRAGLAADADRAGSGLADRAATPAGLAPTAAGACVTAGSADAA
jgi:TRAP-type uncharacterized transport system fused permease subunit